MSAEKRELCTDCGFLIEQCVCQWIPKLKTRLEILVLQDPKEAKHAKNTVSLLALGLPSIKCISTQDRNLLVNTLSLLDKSKWRLIFPCENATPVESCIQDSSKIEGIILLDATWRKAKKMYLTETVLHDFDAISFSQLPIGQYTIRKSPNNLFVSTLEACAYAVEKIAGDNMQPLRDFMVSAQEWQWRRQPLKHRHTDVKKHGELKR